MIKKMNVNFNLVFILLLHLFVTNCNLFLSKGEKIQKAIESNDVEKVKSLITDRTLFFTKDSIVPFYLHTAVKTNNLEMVKLLVENQFPIDNQNVYGNAPILEAYRLGSKEILEYLAKKGANVHGEEGSLMMETLIKEDWKMFEYLLDNATYLKSRNKKNEVLFSVIDKGSLHAVKLFMKRGFSVNTKDEYAGSLLIKASTLGHFTIVKYLCENGANINEKSKYGVSPLSAASNKGHSEIVDYLKELGADVDTIDQ